MLSPLGAEIAKHKSEVIKSYGTEPLNYNETAVFQASRADLENYSLLVQIFSHSSILRRKVPLGWVCLGGGNNESINEAAEEHWYEMIQGMGTTVDKWHHLVRTSYQYLQSKPS